MANIQKGGFALMIVISILGIVSSLIVGFALLSNLENKKIANTLHSPSRIAKQNALRALNEALAKLQAASGQDTVATAKADILGATENKHWVGVWKVDKCNETIVTDQDKKNFIAWLVSGNYYAENDCATVIDSDKCIAIIDPKYTNIDPVYIQLVDITNGNTHGQYAYWVDDQSLKIQGNVYDFGNSFKELSTKLARSSSAIAYKFIKKQCQTKYGLSVIDDYANCPFTQTFLSNHKNIQGEISYTNLLDSSVISDGQKQYLQRRFHDLTNLSLGLLTDTRNGGFRKNLRYKSSDYLSEIPNGAFIFEPPTTLPAPPTTWNYLKSFVNISSPAIRATIPLYRPQAGVNYSDCVLNTATDNGYTTGTITGTNSGDLGIATTCGIYPIWTEFKSYASLYYLDRHRPDNQGDQDAGYYQSLRFQIGFYFENPYVYTLPNATMKIGQWSPFVKNTYLDSGSPASRYQKQPTFRCKIFYNDGTATDFLFQDYPDNPGNKVFPFLSSEPEKYMRPVWEGEITTKYSHTLAKYIKLNSTTSYIYAGRLKSLTIDEGNNPKNYGINDIRFYQPNPHEKVTATQCWMESYPSANSSDWNGTWQNDTDPWTALCLRSTDSSGNIVQQICDVAMNHNALNADRNFICNNTSSWYSKQIPLYLTCVSLRQDASTSSNYGHQYTTNGVGVRPLIEANPRAPLSCRTAHQDDAISLSNNFIPGNWSWCAHWLGLSDGNTTECSNEEHIPFVAHSEFQNLFDLPDPTYKFLNLGFFQHMNAGCFSYHPTYAFGNSYQNPHIPRDRFFQENSAIPDSSWPSHNRVEMLYDYSYCLNRILWDGYFIAATGTASPTVLLNSRQKAFSNAIDSDINSFQNAAENMAIHGAFNVNSTSKDAWAAFLTNNDTNAEYSRIQTIDSISNVGLRTLDIAQIKSLAEKIVEQIKWRGVAGSIGEFVNRKLIEKGSDTAHKLGLKGTLQAAIDDTDINNGYGGTDVVSNRNKSWFDDDAASGPFWACKPGYLTQADILQSTATPLCARGDTFCIYTYGNALDANGNIEAETRCEAMVQRLPELIDPSKPELGRRYKVLAIKWITPPPIDNLFTNQQ
ncbi:MAG: type II secretion system GspH family protein [Puniceicoccales bacterium]|jgi:hypothetical protein|nr:type II secretion system GspH family protein [Puniceicoccales bacterium]